MKKKKIRFFADPLIAIMELLLIVLFYGPVIGMFVATIMVDQLTLVAICIFSFMFISVTIVVFWSIKNCVIVELNQNGIKLYIPYKKPIETPYEDYRYIQIGYYFQGKKGGLGNYRVFVLITKKWIENEKLSQVNLISSDENTVKIELNKKRYEMLCEMLPKWQKNTLIRLVDKLGMKTGDGGLS